MRILRYFSAMLLMTTLTVGHSNAQKSTSSKTMLIIPKQVIFVKSAIVNGLVGGFGASIKPNETKGFLVVETEIRPSKLDTVLDIKNMDLFELIDSTEKMRSMFAINFDQNSALSNSTTFDYLNGLKGEIDYPIKKGGKELAKFIVFPLSIRWKPSSLSPVLVRFLFTSDGNQSILRYTGHSGLVLEVKH